MTSLEKTNKTEIQAASVDPIAAIIQDACTNPDFDVIKLEKMLEMQERREDKAAERQFAEAMANAQQDIPKIVADKFNGQTKSRYPSASSVQNAIKQVASANGLSIFVDEGAKPDAGMIQVRVTLQHRGGHKESYTRYGMIDNMGMKGTANKTDVQGSQATVTYLSRRMLCSIFSVVVLEDMSEDLDGNVVGGELTEDQAFKINEMLEACESLDPGCGKRFFQWTGEAMGFDSLEHARSNHYDAIVNKLQSKLKAGGK